MRTQILGSMMELAYELAAQRQHEINCRPAYYLCYVGCTEPSDMEMDCRTFTTPDRNHDTRRFSPGPRLDDPILDTEMFQWFMDHGYRGAPFPRPEQEPGIPPVWTTSQLHDKHYRKSFVCKTSGSCPPPRGY